MNLLFKNKLCSYKWLTIVFVFSIFLSMINIGHFLSMRAYFHGPPPVSKFASGQAALMVSEVTSLVGSLCGNFILLTGMTSFPIMIGVNLAFVISFIADSVAIFLLGNTTMDEQTVAEYTKSYYSKYKLPPPFIGQIQWDLDGYCCGVSSYQDYVQEGSEYFNVPHSCCYARHRISGKCGSNLWNYLYMFHQNYVTATMYKLERKYRHLDAIPQAQKEAIKSGDVHAFIQEKVPDMYKEKEKIARQNITSDDYKIIRNELLKRQRAYTKEEYDSEVNKFILEKARKLVQDAVDEIQDVGRLEFFPMGCWDFLMQAKKSNWVGFDDYRETIDKFTHEIPGALPGAVLRMLFLIFSALAFNLFSFNLCSSKSKTIGGKLAKHSKDLLMRKVKSTSRLQEKRKRKPVRTATGLRKTENILEDDDTDVRKLLEKKKSVPMSSIKSNVKIGHAIPKLAKPVDSKLQWNTKSTIPNRFLGQLESDITDSDGTTGGEDKEVFKVWSSHKFNQEKDSM